MKSINLSRMKRNGDMLTRYCYLFLFSHVYDWLDTICLHNNRNNF